VTIRTVGIPESSTIDIPAGDDIASDLGGDVSCNGQ